VDLRLRGVLLVTLSLPGGEVCIPESPIVLPSGAFGIWPVGFDLKGATLRYSTAQLFKRVQVNGDTYFFFFAIDNVQPEWMLEPGTKVSGVAGAALQTNTDAGVRLRALGAAQAEVRLPHGVHLVLLPESRAEQVWRVDDPPVLLVTNADAFSDQAAWTLLSEDNDIPFEVFGQDTAPTALEAAVLSSRQDG
jgi:beta-galactosidase